jgi:hypothetical protein
VLCPSRHRRVVHAASGGCNAWLWCSISVVAACCHMRVLLLHDTCSKYCRECLYSILIRQLALQSGALVGKIPWLVTTTRGHQHWRSVVPSSAVQCATILCEILSQQNCENGLPEVARPPIVGGRRLSRWGILSAVRSWRIQTPWMGQQSVCGIYSDCNAFSAVCHAPMLYRLDGVRPSRLKPGAVSGPHRTRS